MIKIDEKDLNAMVKDFKKNFELKYDLNKIKMSLTNAAKSIVYAVHRNEKSKALKLINKLNEEFKKYLKKYGVLDLKDALEEFAEAKLFFGIRYEKSLKNRRIVFDFISDVVFAQELNSLNAIYIGALSDLTGEIMRLSVNFAIKNKLKEILDFKQLVEIIYDYLLKCNLNSELRRKFDAVKWNLDKIHNIIYELELKSRI